MKNRWIRPFFLIAFSALAVLGFGMTDALAAEAKTLGDMTNKVYDSLLSLQMFLSLLSYILGVFFTITGLQLLRAHVDDPGRNPLNAGLLRMGAAAFFIFLPTLANALVHTLGVSGTQSITGQLVGTKDFIDNPGNINGEGLDGALTRFVVDFAGPFLDNLLPIFAYIVGVIFMLVGLKRLALANGDGAQAPGGLGTMGTFLVAAALMAFGYIMYTMQGSVFGTTTLYTNQVFKTSSGNEIMDARAQQALWGVFIFLRIVGYISVLRGLFMLRTVAEGGNVSMMAVGTHMVAGSLLANMGAFVNAIQYTFLGNESNFVFEAIG